jgi:YfiH family protein
MAEMAHDPPEIGLVRLVSLERLGGVQAFFTGRAGGVSQRWAGGLNWSVSVGDDAAAVAENRRRALAIIGLLPEQAVMGGLVHGDRVVVVDGTEPIGPDGVRAVPQCDGLVTDRRGLALVITAADCVPICLFDPVKQVVGAVHAGWRGTVAGIGAQAVRLMQRRFGSNPASIHAAIGPSIGPCCYEVDEQVAVPVRRYYGSASDRMMHPSREPSRHMLDLWAANREDLARTGVRNVAITGECTSCSVDRLFSHRAESGKAGRGAAVIALI